MVTYRQAVRDDAPEITHLYVDLKKEQGVTTVSKLRAIALVSHIVAYYKQYYVAEKGNELIGMVRFVRSHPINYFDNKRSKEVKLKGGFLCDGFVRKKHRGGGAWSSLIDKAEEGARKEGLDFLYTTTSLPYVIKALEKKKYEELGIELMSEEWSGVPKNDKFFRKKF